MWSPLRALHARESWYTRTGSNRRPTRCKRVALPLSYSCVARHASCPRIGAGSSPEWRLPRSLLGEELADMGLVRFREGAEPSITGFGIELRPSGGQVVLRPLFGLTGGQAGGP